MALVNATHLFNSILPTSFTISHSTNLAWQPHTPFATGLSHIKRPQSTQPRRAKERTKRMLHRHFPPKQIHMPDLLCSAPEGNAKALEASTLIAVFSIGILADHSIPWAMGFVAFLRLCCQFDTHLSSSSRGISIAVFWHFIWVPGLAKVLHKTSPVSAKQISSLAQGQTCNDHVETSRQVLFTAVKLINNCICRIDRGQSGLRLSRILSME